MASEGSFERVLVSVARMDKAELKKRIRCYQGRFRLDFTEDYLNAASVDRLRHILVAAMATGRN